MQKKLFSSFLIVFSICTALFFVCSCDNNKQDKSSLTISKNTVTFTEDNLSQDITVNANTKWIFKGGNKSFGTNVLIVDWVQVAPYSGDKGETKVNLSVLPDNKPTEAKNMQLNIESMDSNLQEIITVIFQK